jgi:hypothetical protein
MKGTVRYHSDALPYEVSVVAVPRCVCLFNAHVRNKKDADGLIPESTALLHPIKNVSVSGLPKLFFSCGTLYVCRGGWRGSGDEVGMEVEVENRQICETYALKN